VSVAAVLGDARADGGFWPVAGAVLNPVSGELFAARRGGGARLARGGESRVLRAAPAEELSQSLVGTGFAYDAGVRAGQGEALARLLPRVRDIRRHGAASLDLCAVAAGRLDAYYESGLNPWDHAAAWVVVEEAGLVVRGPHGGRPTRTLTLAGRPTVLDVLEGLVQPREVRTVGPTGRQARP
jgi:myo-inositol-1(or 4)-monophosphatase